MIEVTCDICGNDTDCSGKSDNFYTSRGDGVEPQRYDMCGKCWKEYRKYCAKWLANKGVKK